MFVMAIVNAYILYHETRNENQRNNCYITFFLQKIGEGFAEKGATLAHCDVSQAASSNRLLGRHLTIELPVLARRYILQECVKFFQKSLKILLEKEKEKRLCCGVLIVKCHSACQSASNCTTQS